MKVQPKILKNFQKPLDKKRKMW